MSTRRAVVLGGTGGIGSAVARELLDASGRGSDDWQVDVLFFITAFFTVYAVADQLDVFPYLDLNLLAARVIAALVACTYGVYLWVLDPATRRIARAQAHSRGRTAVL